MDSTTRYQTISGWEATAQAGQEHTAAFRKYRDRLLDLAVEDLGINRLRLEFRSGIENTSDVWADVRAGRQRASRCGRYATVNDNADPASINPAGFHFSLPDHTIEQLVLPMKQRLEAHGQKLFLNANYVSFMVQCPKETYYAHDTPEEYAEFVLASFLHMRDKYGLVPDTWEIILEPENTYFWHGRQIGEAIAASARVLEQHGFRPRFIAPSTARARNAARYFDEMITVPDVLPRLAELSYHRYSGFVEADFVAIADRARRYHVNTAMLEHIGSGYRNLHQDLKVAGVSAWQQFTLAYPGDDDNGAQYYLIRDVGSASPRVELSKRRRYLRQYMHYIRPGAVRVAARSDNARVDPLAFLGPGGRTVVVLKCDGPARVELKGLPRGSYGARYTTADETAAHATVQSRADGSLETTMPAAGVMTIFSP